MIIEHSTLPIFELSKIREHVQSCAKQQWTNLKPERIVCVGLAPFPSDIQNAGEKAIAIIEWLKDMRATFELALPETFVITFNARNFILVSSSVATFAED